MKAKVHYFQLIFSILLSSNILAEQKNSWSETILQSLTKNFTTENCARLALHIAAATGAHYAGMHAMSLVPETFIRVPVEDTCNTKYAELQTSNKTPLLMVQCNEKKLTAFPYQILGDQKHSYRYQVTFTQSNTKLFNKQEDIGCLTLEASNYIAQAFFKKNYYPQRIVDYYHNTQQNNDLLHPRGYEYDPGNNSFKDTEEELISAQQKKYIDQNYGIVVENTIDNTLVSILVDKKTGLPVPLSNYKVVSHPYQRAAAYSATALITFFGSMWLTNAINSWLHNNGYHNWSFSGNITPNYTDIRNSKLCAQIDFC